jgi:hypothetical protein
MSAKSKTLELLILIVVSLIVAVIILLAFAASGQAQELPQAPSASARPMSDFWAAWGTYGAAAATDGLLSSRWAGVGPSPCAWEGNQRYAYPNGKFKSGAYARDNALLFGSLFTVNYLLRKKAPVQISRHWAVRLLSVSLPILKGQEHVRNVVGWIQLCH